MNDDYVITRIIGGLVIAAVVVTLLGVWMGSVVVILLGVLMG